MMETRQKTNSILGTIDEIAKADPLVGLALAETRNQIASAGERFLQLSNIARSETLPQWKQEFGPGYEVPQALTDLFQDVSWHNDVCPSLTLECDNGETLRIWVEHPRRKERECPEQKRFCVQIHTRGSFILETDELDDVITLLTKPTTEFEAEDFIRAWVDAIGQGFHPDSSFGAYVETGTGGNPTIENPKVVLFLEACREACFELLGDRIYEIGLDQMSKHGWGLHPV